MDILLLIFTIGLLAWFLSRSLRRRPVFAQAPINPVTWAVSDALLGIFTLLFLFVVANLVTERMFPGMDQVGRGFISIVHTFLIETVVCVLILIIIYGRGGSLRQSLGIIEGRWVKDLWAGIFCFFIFLPVVLLSGKFMEYIESLRGVKLPRQPIVHLLENARTPGRLGMLIFMALVFAPFAEELLFRVFLYGALRKRYGPGSAIWASALIFSLIHFNLFALLPVFILGLVLGYIYEKRQSIFAPVGLHMVHNGLQVLAFFMSRWVALLV